MSVDVVHQHVGTGYVGSSLESADDIDATADDGSGRSIQAIARKSRFVPPDIPVKTFDVEYRMSALPSAADRVDSIACADDCMRGPRVEHWRCIEPGPGGRHRVAHQRRRAG